MIDQLIQLSKIFKEGYTVEINNGVINQYTNTNKPYVVSYKTLVVINKDVSVKNVNITSFKDTKIPNKCIIGAWLDQDTNIYYIELNRTFKDKNEALIFAIKHEQLAIYDMNNQKVITRYKGVKLK